eukprot:gene12261-biopygen2594
MLRLDHILDHLRKYDTSIGSWWDKECNWVIDPNPDLPLNVRLQNRVEFEEQEKEYGKELREAMQSLYSEGQKLNETEPSTSSTATTLNGFTNNGTMQYADKYRVL